MSWLTVLIAGVALADLLADVRPSRPRTVAALGSAALLVLGGLAGFTTVADGVALAVAVATLVGWRALADRAESSAVAARRTLAALALPAAALVAASGFASPLAGPLAAWVAWMDLPGAPQPADRVAALAALALFNVSSANRVVRYTLVAVGARPPRLDPATDASPAPASERLRGGRLLGPMERLLILGFGAAGTLEAAGLIIAAKGLLRFPELQAAARSDGRAGVDEVTEYFLIGSFASILVALASVALTA